MFGRKLRPEFKSKEYTVVEEGTNIAKTITVPSKYNMLSQLMFHFIGASLIGAAFSDGIVVFYAGLFGICVSLYFMTE